MLRYKFDLKGSTFDRKAKAPVTSKTDRKDLDWLELKKKRNRTVQIAAINKHIEIILRRDVNFLKTHGLIDYSLLLAIELSTQKFKPKKLIKNRIRGNLFGMSVNRQMSMQGKKGPSLEVDRAAEDRMKA